MYSSAAYIGLDVHKATISVSVSPAERMAETIHIGTIANRPGAILEVAKKVAKRHGEPLSFCYEAGPCGYGLYRELTGAGYECVVVAPSLIPTRPGDQIKTDRRDSIKLARMHRAGELISVWVPGEEHEAVRDLIRARETSLQALSRARQSLQSFLLRRGIIYTGKASWTKIHRRWLSRVKLDTPVEQAVFQEYVNAVEEAENRRDRLTKEIEMLIPSWSMGPVVMALQSMRGVGLITAATVVAEVGDFNRFDNPRQVMAFLGLIPSERSSGTTTRRGGITKAGSARARRVLAEGAWSYRFGPRIGREQLPQIEGLPNSVTDIAWKAQLRLSHKFRRLLATGKPKNIAATAIAREMVGFMWAIAREVSPPPESADR
ncbi:IS110 family transposase [Minwuia thermotolerans]|uniref:IS110 family transposase n=1 Tax=Minwuia thermotolerans TaxID=2056226 RepID=A0A2M9FWP7_9PROT|nr:IS110 family transposase [Minwuia thermotolerans]PJK27695.1 IS110 family transposase [Minwuia thermotolerans]PJK27873.1 IS110 family transposase [Minwuia thermotolerans]